MTTDAWKPDLYARFKDERSRPFHDLLGLVERRPGMRIVDLGCGTGELTADLHRELAAQETVGVDSSPTMLAKASARVAPGLRFEQREIDDFAPAAPLDLVFSNAALQWVPDHPRLLARLAGMLAPGGQLAVQVPANDHALQHQVARAVAAEPLFAEALSGHLGRAPLLAPEAYAALLHRNGFTVQRVRLEIYAHRLASREEVVTFVEGGMLTEYRAALKPELFAAFRERFRARLVPQLADEQPFLFPFQRMFIWGRL